MESFKNGRRCIWVYLLLYFSVVSAVSATADDASSENTTTSTVAMNSTTSESSTEISMVASSRSISHASSPAHVSHHSSYEPTSPASTEETVPASTSSTEHASSTSSSSTPSTAVSTSTVPTSPTTAASTTTPSNTNAIIGGVVGGVGGALLIAVVIAIVLFCCRRRCLPLKRSKSTPASATPSIRHPVLKAQPIKVSEFLDYVNTRQANISAYKSEFDSLPTGNKVGKSVSRATQQQNTPLNRYVNILPFNDTLVPLNKADAQQGYINASFVDGYKQEKAYIATQAPVSDSLDHFWKMIWEHECGRVVMVTNLLECGRAKCDKYWPNVGDSITYGSIRVEGIAEKSYGDYILRTFRLEKEISSPKSTRKSLASLDEKEMMERRTVYQFHFTTWPDQGVPNTCSALLKLYRHALKKPLQDCKDGPAVIHCSAGVGRTGTLIALDICLEQAKDTGTVDIPRCLDIMRRQRMYMVQTIEQYIFIHHVLLEALNLDRVVIPVSLLEPIYRQLAEPMLPDGLSRIQREMKILDVLKPRFNHSQFTVAQKNPDKNRLSTLLPADMFLPYVKGEDGLTDVYVNAVHVYGYVKKESDDDDDDEESTEYSYITTQSPMPETFVDFWTMIKETGSSTIVMLNELEGTERYWPEDGRTIEYGSFSITNMGEISSEDIRMTDLQITCKSNSEVIQVDLTTDNRRSTRYNSDTFNIRHFRLLTWPDAMPKETILMSLYSEVLRCQERNPNRPVVVQCLHGVDRCGVFCGVMNVLDGVRLDGEVDVFNAVKRIRKTRPEFIDELSQYKYLYDVAMERIRSLDKVDSTKGSDETTGK